MSCPTCGHTMQAANETVFDNATIFHCPRCGTMKNRDGSFTVPKLVDRCRTFKAKIEADIPTYGQGAKSLLEWLHSAGIIESINRPEDRPPQDEAARSSVEIFGELRSEWVRKDRDLD